MSDQPHKEQPDNESLEKGYEVNRASSRAIVISGIGLSLLVVVSMAAMYWLWSSMQGEFPEEAGRPPEAIALDEPSLQEQPAIEPMNLMYIQLDMLDDYAWVDREAGVARIPIKRAMVLLAERDYQLPEQQAAEEKSENAAEPTDQEIATEEKEAETEEAIDADGGNDSQPSSGEDEQ